MTEAPGSAQLLTDSGADAGSDGDGDVDGDDDEGGVLAGLGCRQGEAQAAMMMGVSQASQQEGDGEAGGRGRCMAADAELRPLRPEELSAIVFRVRGWAYGAGDRGWSKHRRCWRTLATALASRRWQRRPELATHMNAGS